MNTPAQMTTNWRRPLAFAAAWALASGVIGTPDALAKGERSAWSERPVAEVFGRFPYAYRVGFELEISPRTLPLIVRDLDCAEIESAIDGMNLADYAVDYLNERTLAELRANDPALAARLTDGLDLDPRAVRTHILSLVDTERSARLAQFRAVGAATTLVTPSRPTLLIDSAPAIPVVVARDAAGDAKGLITDDATAAAERLARFRGALAAAPAPAEFVSDWTLLNRRWNALPWADRAPHVRYRALGERRQAELVAHLLRVSHACGEPIDLLGGDAGPVWRALECTLDEGQTVELRPRVPYASARAMLGALGHVAQQTNLFPWIKEPTSSSRRDSSYHLNFSVSDRPEDLGPVLWAWQNLIVLKQLEAGILNLFEGNQVFWNWNLREKGMVRLRAPNWIEVRDHFTNPEDELAMLMEAIRRPNAAAVRHIYDAYMPAITPAMLRYIFHASSTAFIEIVFNSPGLRVDLPADLIDAGNVARLADEVFQSAGYDARILREPAAITGFLGPVGTALLRAHVARYLSEPNAETPENEIILREFLAFEKPARACEALLWFGPAAGAT